MLIPWLLYINLIMPWEESRDGTAGFVSSVSLANSSALTLLSHSKPCPGWMVDKDHQPLLSHPILQCAIGTPHLPGTYKHVHTHSHMTEKPQWKSQTCSLIFTKSVPVWLYLSFVISAGTGEWQGVTRVRLLFQHLLKEREGGTTQGKGPPLTQLLNPPHPSPPL